MRIELPAAAWTDALLQAQDDAHTLTLPPQAAPGRPERPGAAEGPAEVRIAVDCAAAPVLTLTF